MQDSPDYLRKKAFFKQLLTLYGRKPVLEAISDKNLVCTRLHLAESNKPDGIIREIVQWAEKRSVETVYHTRQELSRISKNGKQDQGVCLDIHCDKHQNLEDFLKQPSEKPQRLLALDRVTNPQNIGMIIRAASGGDIDGIIIPEQGSARLDALVIKASAGTLFKAPILRCKNIKTALEICTEAGYESVGLTGHTQHKLADFEEPPKSLYILGNETEGISQEILAKCTHKILIPMNNGIESLNVAVAAALIAFRFRV